MPIKVIISFVIRPQAALFERAARQRIKICSEEIPEMIEVGKEHYAACRMISQRTDDRRKKTEDI